MREQILITPAGLADLIASSRPVTILAVRSPDTSAPRPFEASPRIPGAIEADMTIDFASPTDPIEGSRPLPSLLDLERAVAGWGIGPDSVVVVYDHDGGLIAARAWWVLRWAGIEARLLDGGFRAWQAAWFETAGEPPAAPAQSDLRITLGHLPTFGPDDAVSLGRTGTLLDSRVHENYVGAPTGPGEPRRGHIPGAIAVPAPTNLDEEGRFLDEAGLIALYGETGALGGGRVGVYCGAGVSAAHDIAALATLGIDSALYPGSWSAWISDPERPAVIGPDRG